MAAVVFVAATALAGGLTAPVASHRGGLAPFLGLRSPDDAQTEQQVEAPPIHEAYADAAGAPPPGPAGACPDDMVRFEKEGDMLLCIDAGEFPGLREVPQVNVTLDDARDSCRAKGRRLCSTVEWERACTGPKGEKYPYGNDYGRGVCNEARADGAGRNLSRSGASDRCVSAEGAFDLVGNVGEWVEEGVVLGGDANARKPTCGTKQEARASSKSASTGFRCCLVVHTQPLP
jgi:hypothetical protein